MQAPTSVDLARTRAAFDAWRATQSGRRRIPEHIWQMALALLDEHAKRRDFPAAYAVNTLGSQIKGLRRVQV